MGRVSIFPPLVLAELVRRDTHLIPLSTPIRPLAGDSSAGAPSTWMQAALATAKVPGNRNLPSSPPYSQMRPGTREPIEVHKKRNREKLRRILLSKNDTLTNTHFAHLIPPWVQKSEPPLEPSLLPNETCKPRTYEPIEAHNKPNRGKLRPFMCPGKMRPQGTVRDPTFFAFHSAIGS